MRISRLRLLGFKSFIEPTELVIEHGLTGVVGPNGCGKSNLLEALRWVMGETSHKSMRAASMNDVIFSGTANRPARNTAEVTMFLDNAERKAPADYNDTDIIEITRRIERDAGSAYRINGREARAKDVKILFEDAATGARSHALVRQGQIGDIVNAKPEARRRILEDAAGIAGLHSRRHDAELRLRAAETNLTRLDDVLGGLTGQIESLKRQARQARRYKDLSHDLRRTQAMAMHVGWLEAEQLANDQERLLRETLAQLAQATQAETAALGVQTQHSDALQPLRDEEAKCAGIFGRLNVEQENLERERERTAQRVRELNDRSEQLERDIAREQNFAREAADIITRLEREIADNVNQEQSAETATQSAQTELEKADTVLNEGETRLAELTRKHADHRARCSSLEASLAESQKATGRLDSQLKALDAQAAEIASHAPDAQLLGATAATGRELATQILDIERDTLEAEQHIRELAPQLKAKREAAATALHALNALRTERETLAKMLLPAQGDEFPSILDALTVEPGYETALGAALGDDLDAPTTDASPVHWRHIKTPTTDAPLPVSAKPLTDYVDAPPELARRLAQIGVIADQDGPSLQPALQPGQRLVTRDGDLWRWDGFTAASHGITPAAVRLAQRNRLTAVAHEEIAASETAERLNLEEQQTHDALTKLQHNEETLRNTWRQHQTELAKVRDDLTVIERRARDTESKLAAIEGAKTRSQQDLTDAREKTQQIKTALDHSNTQEGNDLGEALEKVQIDVRTLRANAAQKQAARAGLEREHELRLERLSTQRKELESWRQRAQSATQQADTLKTRFTQTSDELQSLADLPTQMDAHRQKLLNALNTAENNRKSAADNLATAETVLKDASLALRTAQAFVSETREQRARTEARLEAAQERHQQQAHRITETLNVAPENCLALAEHPDDTDLPALHDVDQRLARLTADRERLGGVNLQADDELSELAEQLAAIETDRSDVEQAIEKLRGSINQLNREGRKRLREAFEIVDQHFRRLFSVLFDGGEARLEMIESEEDPLEGGLEIIARPPGKKPATLSLLSGGEQTLTALSLIFAVFLTNPSPICVLDEVDAPLDDANIDRFCTLMERMAEETSTRFLVITHHPMTMTRMNRLFGVTMVEKGISQLVSVDLETAQGFREAS